jgi:hypothetical protein
MTGTDAAPKCDILDAEHASVTPNPAGILLGPAKATPSLQLVRKEGEWKFQLEAPLTDADAEAIKAYHAGLRAALDEIVEWLEKTPAVDEAQLKKALASVVQGKPAGLEGAAPAGQAGSPGGKGGAGKGAEEGQGKTPPKPGGRGRSP